MTDSFENSWYKIFCKIEMEMEKEDGTRLHFVMKMEKKILFLIMIKKL